MTRIPYPDEGAISSSTHELLERLPPLNLFAMLAHADSGAKRFLRATFGLWRDAELSAYNRELVILVTARACEADYEWQQHVPIARAVGVDEPTIKAIADRDLRRNGVLESDRAVLALAHEIAARPRCSDQTMVDATRYLSPREVVEAHLIVGIYFTLARIATNLEIDIDAPVMTDNANSALPPSSQTIANG